MSILTKIAIVLTSSLALRVAFTPPHTSKQDERVPENVTFADHVLTFSECLRKAVPKIYLGVGLLEIATILLYSSFSKTTTELPREEASCAANLVTPSPVLVLGALLIVFGALLRYQCYRTLQKFFTYEFTIQKDHSLITQGPYQIVRHPSYTGLLFIYIGIFCYFLSPGSWLRECGGLDTILGKLVYGGFISIRVATFWALLKRMPKEDEALRKQFGKKWDEWAESVRYRLIPGVY